MRSIQALVTTLDRPTTGFDRSSLWMLRCSFGGSGNATFTYRASANLAVCCSNPLSIAPHVRVNSWGLISSKCGRQRSQRLTFTSPSRWSRVVVRRLESAKAKQQAHTNMDGQSSGPVLKVQCLTFSDNHPAFVVDTKPHVEATLEQAACICFDCCRIWCC